MKRSILILISLYIYQLIAAQSDIAILNITNESVALPEESLTTNISHSFDLVNGMMVIEAVVNGKQGKFILDTGAPGIVLNDIPTKISEEYLAGGLAGRVEIEEIAINDFQWGEISLKNLNGFNIDMSHLETALDIPIKGLIGFDVLKNYELVIDFDAKLIQILDARGSYFQKEEAVFYTIPFDLEGHLPIIQAKIGTQKIRFGIDTGASVNIIDTALRSTITAKEMDAIRIEEMRGLDQQIIQYESAIINNIQIENEDLTSMRYLFTDMTHINQGASIPIDGLLGGQFFKAHRIAINYEKRKIFIAEK